MRKYLAIGIILSVILLIPVAYLLVSGSEGTVHETKKPSSAYQPSAAWLRTGVRYDYQRRRSHLAMIGDMV
jgi:hypothetical protein